MKCIYHISSIRRTPLFNRPQYLYINQGFWTYWTYSMEFEPIRESIDYRGFTDLL